MLELLDTLCLDHFFTAQQAHTMLQSIDTEEMRASAAARIFTRIVDPENWHSHVAASLTTDQQAQVLVALGGSARFNPRNATGRYTLLLACQADAVLAARLLDIYRQQWSQRLCAWPLHSCFVEFAIDGSPIEVKQPHAFALPASGALDLSFIDLQPLSSALEPMPASTFAALRSLLLHSKVPACQAQACHACVMTLLPNDSNLFMRAPPALINTCMKPCAV